MLWFLYLQWSSYSNDLLSLSFIFYLQRRRRLYKHYLVCHFVFPKAICIQKSSFSMTNQKASLLLKSTPPFFSNSFIRYLQPICLSEAKSWKIITKPLTCSADTKPRTIAYCQSRLTTRQSFSCQVQRHVGWFFLFLSFIHFSILFDYF